MNPGAIVIMGVTCCGKTTFGVALAEKLGAKFVEGDKLHSPESIAKMSSGLPLGDADRWPWLERIGQSMQGEACVVATCSALKRTYRQAIVESACRTVTFIHLHGDKAILAARIAARKNHFMPPSLLDSQLATLETPDTSENAMTIDIALPRDDQVAIAMKFLRKEQN